MVLLHHFCHLDNMAIAKDNSGVWSFPTWPRHLDHIMINNQLFEAQQGSETLVEEIRLHDHMDHGWSFYERNLSDHLPVVMRISVP
jgi:hypothetical protein